MLLISTAIWKQKAKNDAVAGGEAARQGSSDRYNIIKDKRNNTTTEKGRRYRFSSAYRTWSLELAAGGFCMQSPTITPLRPPRQHTVDRTHLPRSGPTDAELLDKWSQLEVTIDDSETMKEAAEYIEQNVKSDLKLLLHEVERTNWMYAKNSFS